MDVTFMLSQCFTLLTFTSMYGYGNYINRQLLGGNCLWKRNSDRRPFTTGEEKVRRFSRKFTKVFLRNPYQLQKFANVFINFFSSARYLITYFDENYTV